MTTDTKRLRELHVMLMPHEHNELRSLILAACDELEAAREAQATAWDEGRDRGWQELQPGSTPNHGAGNPYRDTVIDEAMK